jgi:hypothetical protein
MTPRNQPPQLPDNLQGNPLIGCLLANQILARAGCYGCLLVVLAVLIILACVFTSKTLAFTSSASRTSGTVIGHYDGFRPRNQQNWDKVTQGRGAGAHGSGRQFCTWTTVRFTASNGAVITFDTGHGPQYPVGATVTVLYDPANPWIAEIPSPAMWFTTIWFCLVCLPLIWLVVRMTLRRIALRSL